MGPSPVGEIGVAALITRIVYCPDEFRSDLISAKDRRPIHHLPGGEPSTLKPRNAHEAATARIKTAIGGPKSKTGISRKSPAVLNLPSMPLRMNSIVETQIQPY